jgi:hypothetical protein
LLLCPFAYSKQSTLACAISHLTSFTVVHTYLPCRRPEEDFYRCVMGLLQKVRQEAAEKAAAQAQQHSVERMAAKRAAAERAAVEGRLERGRRESAARIAADSVAEAAEGGERKRNTPRCLCELSPCVCGLATPEEPA